MRLVENKFSLNRIVHISIFNDAYIEVGLYAQTYLKRLKVTFNRMN